MAARLQTMLAAVPEKNANVAPCKSHGSSPDDIVIVGGARTALCKARRGMFKDTPCADMLAVAMKEAMARAGISPAQVDDVVIGNCGMDGAGALQMRVAAFLAGIPKESSAMAINRQCSSGLQAIANVATAISAGFYNIGIAGGVESMSTPGPTPKLSNISSRLSELQEARDCLTPMGVTSENVAKQFGIDREMQDKFALSSYQRALAAQKAGAFTKEIVPVSTKVKDKEGKTHKVTVDKDEGPRPTTLEGLQKLKPSFAADGASHAGNSSQTTDGAAAVVLCKRSTATQLGLPILGVFRGFAVKGVPPRVMGIGPAVAIPAVLKQTGYAKDDIDVFELNEAFASQALYCMKELGLDSKKVNPLGGAIALGHPLGCTGTRCTVTLLHHLQATQQNTGVVSMCIGTGMGAAAVFTRE
ncbi:3-ketoacyl-CoA thiolase 1 [Diplonema papillatum]|nr:3-ketoacyl-CoA thiolase 1 [Diplonema papillatum]